MQHNLSVCTTSSSYHHGKFCVCMCVHVCQGVPTTGIYSWGKSDISGVTMDTVATELQYLWVGGLESGCACTFASYTYTHTDTHSTPTHNISGQDTWSFSIFIFYKLAKPSKKQTYTHSLFLPHTHFSSCVHNEPPGLFGDTAAMTKTSTSHAELFLLLLLTRSSLFQSLPPLNPDFLSLPLLHIFHSDSSLWFQYVSQPHCSSPHLRIALSFTQITQFTTVNLTVYCTGVMSHLYQMQS